MVSPLFDQKKPSHLEPFLISIPISFKHYRKLNFHNYLRALFVMIVRSFWVFAFFYAVSKRILCCFIFFSRRNLISSRQATVLFVSFALLCILNIIADWTLKRGFKTPVYMLANIKSIVFNTKNHRWQAFSKGRLRNRPNIIPRWKQQLWNFRYRNLWVLWLYLHSVCVFLLWFSHSNLLITGQHFYWRLV